MILQGKRQPDETSPHLFEPGDYGKYEEEWFGMTPDGKLAGLKNHTVVEHEDRTITVSPSIKCWNNQSEWHGYLERGTWRSC